MGGVTGEGAIGRKPELAGQTVVVIGGSSGIGLETVRLARAEGAQIVVAGRDAERVSAVAREIGALQFEVFDAEDPTAMARFFRELPGAIDHVMVTAGHPTYGRILDTSYEDARDALSSHMILFIESARNAAGKVKPGGSLIFMGGTGARRPAVGIGIASAVTAAMPSLTANLALELAPVRVNLIAPGFVDSPLSAQLLGSDLEKRREHLREMLPIRRVVTPADVAALAIHLMSNTALTGATYDIDGGQQFV
jgi:NAD(P)-dependent dehydrogenase (short-subunit alcohol dehydrogenase family)